MGVVYTHTRNIATLKGGDAVSEPEADLVEAAEAARILGVERSTVTRYEQRRLIVPVDVKYEGRRRKPLFRRADVEKLKPDHPPEQA